MPRILSRIVLPALLLGAVAGCTRLDYAAGPQKPVLANRALPRPHRITSEFVEKGRRYYLFWGLVPFGGVNGEDLIARRITLGDGIVNFTAREKFSIVDWLVNLVTAGIVSSRSMEIRGDIFAWEPPPPGTTVIVPPAGGTVVVPPASPPAPGTVVVPPSSGGTVVVPPGSGGTVVVP
jgi:hypothetical protein